MKKIKLLVSLSIVAMLSMAIVNEVVKIENTNKAEIAESINNEKALIEYENKKEQNSGNTEEEVVDSKQLYEESNNIEKKIIENKEAENKVIVKNNDSIQNYSLESDKLPNRGNNINGEENTTYNDEVVSVSEIEDQILIRVNTERTTNGLEPLINNNTMQKYARLKAKDMGDRGYFDHKNPEGELITSQMKKDGATYESWAENIAYIRGDFSNSILADNFMNNWMKSQSHRENILSKKFTSIGIGVYKTGNTYYVTQQFHK